MGIEIKNNNLELENAELKRRISELEEEVNAFKKGKFTGVDFYKDRFYRITENVNDVIYRMSLPDCIYEYISPQVKLLTGYEQDEFYNTPKIVRKIIHEDFIKEFIDAWKKLINGYIPEYYEYKIVRKDGEVRWVMQKNLIILNEDKKPIAIEGIVTDISHRKDAEESLIESEAQIKAILNNLPHMSWLKDCDGHYLAVNDSFAESIFLTPEEVIGKTDYDLFEPEIAQQYRDQDLQILIKKEQVYFEQKNGDLFFETFKAPIFDNRGNTIGLTGISLEISKRKLAEKEIKEYSEQLAIHNAKLKIINDELKKAKEKAEESDKLKSAFLANMSHEIRTPMNAILGFATLLKNRKLPDEKRDNFIDLINSNCRQLLRIITDIIDISKIESGQITLYNKNFNINTVLKVLQDNYNGQIRTVKKNIQLIFNPALPDQDAMIFADRLRIEQVVSNFLSNAVKFTHEGCIEFGYVFNNKGEIEFFVKDTGIGMTLEEQKIVFDRFRQASSSYNKIYGGTGLGLSISKGLSDIMGGRIDLISEKNQGSTFSFFLPYRPGYKPDDKIPEVTADVEYNWNNKIILIAEDEEANYSLLENIIKPTNAEIIRAYNGKEAVEIALKSQQIDLILMDIKMPEMNGLQATKLIKQKKNKIPIIAQTAYAMASDEENCKEAGCDDYFSKPLSIDDLLRKINLQLQK
ncbi:MAG: ATP-binding protein [Bacteroidales bacterium]|nr:ATP-binding protein [Bacteroidales bacterium]